jgi:hypothetical protein
LVLAMVQSMKKAWSLAAMDIVLVADHPAMVHQ